MSTRRVARAATVALSATMLTAVWPGVVSAHNVAASRFDAPIPLWALYGGAAFTVAATALLLAVTDSGPSREEATPIVTLDARLVRWLRFAVATTFLLAVVTAIVAGLLGRQVAAENVVTLFTWPVWFHGLGLAAVFVGSFWPTLSPWRTVYRGLCRMEGGWIAVLDGYPPWLGTWPALVGFLVLIGVVESLTIIPQSPAATSAVIAAYALVMLGGALLVGPVWFDRADPLGVLYRLFGRVASVTRTETDSGSVRIAVRPPWQGCTRPATDLAVAVFVVAALYTVSFDGFTNTTPYRTVLFGARRAFGTGPATSVMLYAIGLLGAFGVFVGTVKLGDRLAAMERRDRATPPKTRTLRETVTSFAPTAVPIAAAYDVAHNSPYVVRNAARLLEVTTATGGWRSVSVAPLAWLSVPMFWATQVVLVVLGHVVAVVAAHRVAVERYPTATAARRGHLPLVVLMIGYTVLSLWIISQPVVAG